MTTLHHAFNTVQSESKCESKCVGHFETSVYRKETDADAVLHFASNHPACQKRSCIKALFGRVDKVRRLAGKKGHISKRDRTGGQ